MSIRIALMENGFPFGCGATARSFIGEYHGQNILPDDTLKRTERNDILTWIRKHGLDPADFEWTEDIRNESDGFDQF
jgi:hypothetical protein